MAFCLLLCWGDSQLENLHLCSDSSRSLVRPANIVFSCMCNCFFLIEKHYNYCFYLIVHFFFLFVILFVSSHCFPIFLNGKIFFFFFFPGIFMEVWAFMKSMQLWYFQSPRKQCSELPLVHVLRNILWLFHTLFLLHLNLNTSMDNHKICGRSDLVL